MISLSLLQMKANGNGRKQKNNALDSCSFKSSEDVPQVDQFATESINKLQWSSLGAVESSCSRSRTSECSIETADDSWVSEAPLSDQSTSGDSSSNSSGNSHTNTRNCCDSPVNGDHHNTSSDNEGRSSIWLDDVTGIPCSIHKKCNQRDCDAGNKSLHVIPEKDIKDALECLLKEDWENENEGDNKVNADEQRPVPLFETIEPPEEKVNSTGYSKSKEFCTKKNQCISTEKCDENATSSNFADENITNPETLNERNLTKNEERNPVNDDHRLTECYNDFEGRIKDTSRVLNALTLYCKVGQRKNIVHSHRAVAEKYGKLGTEEYKQSPSNPTPIPSSDESYSEVTICFVGNFASAVAERIFEDALRILQQGGLIYVIDDYVGNTVDRVPVMKDFLMRLPENSTVRSIWRHHDEQAKEIIRSRGVNGYGINDDQHFIRWLGIKPIR